MNKEASMTVYWEYFRWGSQQFPYILESIWNGNTGKLIKFRVFPMAEMRR